MTAGTETLAQDLLAHFDRTGRDMPWRRTSDPYAIWVSEVMLQQTRVDAVIPYYERWLRDFPDVASLADADTATVLRAWEGLGYYSRARNLHAAARTVRERLNGALPTTTDELRTLPGIGAYTAGAISSIAFGRVEPAVDGNARRVFARLLDLEQPTFPDLQKIIRNYIPADRPGDFNQAVMELGATICAPRPHCNACPVQKHCVALKNGTVALRPRAKVSKKIPSFDLAVAVVMDARNYMYLVQRPDRGLLAGFWELPASPLRSVARAAQNARNIARRIAPHPDRARRLDVVRHAFSHRVECYHPFVFRTEQTTNFVCDVGGTWFSPSALQELPVSAAQRRIIEAARIQSGP
jgi:A/G-specific adenine glycosylase